ncbi:MAG: MmcQ/YjbR family DNA-binding protein [Candidatus Saccharibacteria bacterium]
MDLRTLKKYLKLSGAKLSHPYGKDISVYSIGDEMFALVEHTRTPIRISLRCDRQLAKILEERYVEVMPGHKLNRNKWITVVLSGQLDNDEVRGLIYHSYDLASKED